MKMEFTYNKADVTQLLDKLARSESKCNTFALKLFKQQANVIKTESLSQVPVDTGTLKSSFFIKQLNKNTIYLGYGGFGEVYINPKNKMPVTSYMIKVHEDLTVHHDIGNAKFFENPLRRAEERLSNLLSITFIKVFKEEGGK